MILEKIGARNLAAISAGLVLIPAVSFESSLFNVSDSGNVGIGNSDPRHKLDVSGALYSRLVAATSIMQARPSAIRLKSV